MIVLLLVDRGVNTLFYPVLNFWLGLIVHRNLIFFLITVLKAKRMKFKKTFYFKVLEYKPLAVFGI